MEGKRARLFFSLDRPDVARYANYRPSERGGLGAVYVRLTPDSSHWVDRLTKGKKRPEAYICHALGYSILNEVYDGELALLNVS